MMQILLMGDRLKLGSEPADFEANLMELIPEIEPLVEKRLPEDLVNRVLMYSLHTTNRLHPGPYYTGHPKVEKHESKKSLEIVEVPETPALAQIIKVATPISVGKS